MCVTPACNAGDAGSSFPNLVWTLGLHGNSYYDGGNEKRRKSHHDGGDVQDIGEAVNAVLEFILDITNKQNAPVGVKPLDH